MIIRDAERIKRTSEVFTPEPLVDLMLDKLPKKMWKKKETFIDNSCGDGNFLVRVLWRKMNHGSSAEEALSTTFGVDIMQDNVLCARERLLNLAKDLEPKMNLKKCRKIVNTNIVCHDALTYDYSFGQKSETLLTF